MHQIQLTVTIADQDLRDGWGGDLDEFVASTKAALHEVVGDDGMAYVPTVARA